MHHTERTIVPVRKSGEVAKQAERPSYSFCARGRARGQGIYPLLVSSALCRGTGRQPDKLEIAFRLSSQCIEMLNLKRHDRVSFDTYDGNTWTLNMDAGDKGHALCGNSKGSKTLSVRFHVEPEELEAFGIGRPAVVEHPSLVPSFSCELESSDGKVAVFQRVDD